MTQQNQPAPTDLTAYLTFRMARAQNKLNAQATRILKQHSDLSLVEWRVIQLLRHFEGSSMSRLAAEVQMDKGQLSRKINAMVEKQLILSVPDSTDHRRQHLHLTQRAIEISRAVMPIMERRQHLLMQEVAPEDAEVFFSVLEKISKAAENADVTE